MHLHIEPVRHFIVLCVCVCVCVCVRVWWVFLKMFRCSGFWTLHIIIQCSVMLPGVICGICVCFHVIARKKKRLHCPQGSTDSHLCCWADWPRKAQLKNSDRESVFKVLVKTISWYFTFIAKQRQKTEHTRACVGRVDDTWHLVTRLEHANLS